MGEPKVLKIYKAQIDPDATSELEVNFIGLVDKPAIERNFQAFKAQEKHLKFTLNEEKRIISGPAMIADMPLYRNDKEMGEYYVVFDRDAIRTISRSFPPKVTCKTSTFSMMKMRRLVM